MLDTIHPTAMGLNGFPDWFIRIAAAALAKPVTHLFNLSLNFSVVSCQWKASRNIPIPKITQPLTCQLSTYLHHPDNIQINGENTCHISFLYPILLSPEYSNSFGGRFAYRPIGSTTLSTYALIYLFHQVTIKSSST